MPPKGTRRLAGGSKNSTSTPNRLTNRENTSLNLPAETPEQSRSRSSHTEPRETPIPSDTDRESSSSQDRSQSNPTDTGNSGNIMAAPKPILPLPGTLGTPHFTGTGVTSFLTNYGDMCEDYNVEERERVRRCPRYCAEHIAVAVRGLAAFIEPNWERLKKEMAKQFRETDPMQQMYTRGFLDALVKASRTAAEVSQFCMQFKGISEQLLAEGKISATDQTKLFMKGLPIEVQRGICYQGNVDFEDDKSVPIDVLVERAKKVASAEQSLRKFSQPKEERGKFDGLIEQLQFKPDPSAGQSQKERDGFVKQEDIERMVDAISLLVGAKNVEQYGNVMPQRDRTFRPPPPEPRNQGQFYVPTMTQDQPRYPGGTNPGGYRPQRRASSDSLTGQRGCWFCKVPGHRHQTCIEMRDWEDKGRIHWSPDRTALYLGREDQGSTIMVSAYPAEGKTIKDNVIAAEAARTIRMGTKGM
jgi:hypothetical protein